MTKNKKPKGKVLVALSGGVDSAVAAALLKKEGYEVIGVHFIFFDSSAERNRAEKIAKRLKIKLIARDAKKEFKKRIIGYFIDAYGKGLTPNPCVACNKEMKFRLLFDLMKKCKADFVATGHYAQIRKTRNAKRITRSGKELQFTSYELREAFDKSKDQSYFLHRLNQADLSRIIFPLGNYKKSEVKRMAKKMKLPIAKEESQDICFLGDKTLETFLKAELPKSKYKTGKIKDLQGRTLGAHRGLPLYTIGQRKGIEIGPPASCREREALRARGTRPYYVVGKNLRRNELIVTNDEKDLRLLTKEFKVSQVNWIGKTPKFPLRAKVQIRYHAEKFSAIIKPDKPGRLSVKTKKPLRAVTPGQAAVFYKNGEVLGGGIIAS